MLARHLSRVMMVGLEVALELWQALTVSPQAQWLDYAGDTGLQLRAELNLQAEQVGCCQGGVEGILPNPLLVILSCCPSDSFPTLQRPFSVGLMLARST